VEVSAGEWRTFRGLLVNKGKTVKAVLAGYVRNYIKRESRKDREKVG